MLEEHFWLRIRFSSWNEVTRDEFIQAEKNAGFYSKDGHGPATAGFSNNMLQGKITWDEPITKDI